MPELYTAFQEFLAEQEQPNPPQSRQNLALISPLIHDFLQGRAVEKMLVIGEITGVQESDETGGRAPMHRINKFKQLSLAAAKRISSVVLALMIAAMLVFLTTTSKRPVPTVHASIGCTEATLTGNYGFMWQGFDVLRQGTGAQLPWASAGVLNFDGQGGVSVVVVGSSIGGKISLDQTPSSGNYTVAPDCTGSMSFTSGPGAGETLNIVIVSAGAEAFLMSTTPTQTFAADAKRQ